MRLELFGVRGSIPTPGPQTVRYGGNTTCLYVEVADRHLVIDAGTGIRLLGQKMMQQSRGGMNIDMFITHSHTDHIMGFPFFGPLYGPDNVINVYGKLHYEKTLEEVMSGQMDYSYFPLRAAELPSTLSFHEMENHEVVLGDVVVRSQVMNHPVMMQAYRIEYQGQAIVFSGDMEPYFDVLESLETTEMAIEANQVAIDFFRGADVLVIDTTYTTEEYETKRGWGHNCITHSVWFGGEAGVKNLVLTHHEPSRSDDEVDTMLQEALKVRDDYGYEFESLTMAQEGQVFEL